MGTNISPNAQSGFNAAGKYDKERPSYFPEAVTKVLEESKVLSSSRARIIDLAAGTGKFTELLASRQEDYEIVAVEPHAEMRGVLEKKQLKGVTILDGSATNMKAVEDGWADAVVVAQVSLSVCEKDNKC